MLAMLDKVVFAKYTVLDVLMAGGGLIALIVVVKILKGIFLKPKMDAHSQVSKCKCGWTGKVSVYAGVCPQCGDPLGQQRAR